MRKTMEWLKRGFLALAVVVALTPCGVCHASASTGTSAMKSCDMGSMEGMKCCHSAKSPNPLCKVMDQSSLASAVQVLPVVLAPISTPLTGMTLTVKGFVTFAVGCSSVSPPRAPLSLRI